MNHLQNKERIQKSIERRDSQYIYQNELGQASFQHDMDYGNFKDLTGRTASDKMLRDKAFKIAKNPKYDGYQCGLATIIFKFSDKKTSGSGMINDNTSNKKLTEELHKSIIKKFNKYTWVIPVKDKKDITIAFLVGISIGIARSRLGLKICAITAGIKNINQ